MGRRRTGGKRKPLYVECAGCRKRFEFWTDGSAYERSPVQVFSKVEVKIVLAGRRRDWPESRVYRPSEWRHECGGKLRRIDIPDPVRKVVDNRGLYEKLECGHEQMARQDIFGYTVATRRACAECGKQARIEAVRSGKMEAWEVGL